MGMLNGKLVMDDALGISPSDLHNFNFSHT